MAVWKAKVIAPTKNTEVSAWKRKCFPMPSTKKGLAMTQFWDLDRNTSIEFCTSFPSNLWPFWGEIYRNFRHTSLICRFFCQPFDIYLSKMRKVFTFSPWEVGHFGNTITFGLTCAVVRSSWRYCLRGRIYLIKQSSHSTIMPSWWEIAIFTVHLPMCKS